MINWKRVNLGQGHEGLPYTVKVACISGMCLCWKNHIYAYKKKKKFPFALGSSDFLFWLQASPVGIEMTKRVNEMD